MPINSIFGWFMKKRMHQIELFKKYPVEVQLESFERLIDEGKQTVYGLENSMDTVVDYTDFKTKIP